MENGKDTFEKIKEDMEDGQKDEEVYTDEGREKLIDNDEISPEEEGFMEGAEGRGGQQCCSECGIQLGEEKDEIIEREFDGEIKNFCSDEHAENYAKKHKEE